MARKVDEVVKTGRTSYEVRGLKLHPRGIAYQKASVELLTKYVDLNCGHGRAVVKYSWMFLSLVVFIAIYLDNYGFLC